MKAFVATMVVLYIFNLGVTVNECTKPKSSNMPFGFLMLIKLGIVAWGIYLLVTV